MRIYLLSKALPFLAIWSRKVCRLPMRAKRLQGWKVSTLALAVCAFSHMDGQAFTQVLIDPKAPAGIEEAFIASTTNQYNAKLVKNPLASHTYTLTILGSNPAYNAPPAPPSTLEQALSLGSTVYVYGFANGQDYQRHIDQGIIGTEYSACVSTDTCQQGLGRASNDIYNLGLSAPSVIP